MKCKFCQNELKEGRLYCESCGKPVQMVPIFEPEVEARMTETLAAIAVDDVIHGVDDVTIKKGFPKAIFAVVAAIIAAGVITVAVFEVNTSYSAYYKKGIRAMDEEKYEQAVDYFNRALDRHGGSVEVQFRIADAYLALGEDAKALSGYLDIIDVEPDNMEAYAGAVAIYESAENYDAIGRLISTCKEEAIYEEFKGYLAFPPEFSDEEGTYHERRKIRLTAETKGTIYYTLDGSEPGTDSIRYIAPITLNPGNNVVRAVFVNEKGILSDSVSKIYDIELTKPEEPSVVPASGNYQLPEYIEVTAPEGCEIFYTTDGTDPTNQSEKYEGPLPMPLNGSRFKFVAYSRSHKIYSSVVDSTYHLDFNGACTSQVAANYIAATLTMSGKILDVDGNALGKDGQYKYHCTSAVRDGNDYYYLVEESYLPASGEAEKTGVIYAVNAFDFTIKTIQRDSKGNLIFQLFQ